MKSETKQMPEDADISIEEWKRKYAELKVLLSEKTAELLLNSRELEIEAALERVRAKTMAMQKSDELLEVTRVLYAQLKNLGFERGVASIIIMDSATGDFDWWMEGSDDGYHLPVRYHVPFFNHKSHIEQLDHWKSGTTFASVEVSGSEKKTYDEYYFTKTDFIHAPENSKQLMMQQESVRFSMAYMLFGALSWSPTPISDEQVTILKRFAKVFDQSYTRFLDLQKAEAQAREAQIEAALERVRSRSMAMRESDELKEVVEGIFTALDELGYNPAACTILNFTVKDINIKGWSSVPTENGLSVFSYTSPLEDHPLHHKILRYKKNKEPFLIYHLKGEDKIKHDTLFFESINLPEMEVVLRGVKETYANIIFMSQGAIVAWTNEPLNEVDITLLQRFSKVVDLSYTRFIDLKKAEALAREAQIEAALERVRARAMAMHSSAELKDVAIELRHQLGLIGQKDLEVCAIHLYEEDPDYFESWGAMRVSESENEILHGTAKYPKSGIRIVDEMMQFYHSDENDYVILNEKEKAVEWLEVLKKYSPEVHASIMNEFKGIPVDQLSAYWSVSDFTGGSLVMVTHMYPDESSRDLLSRSAKVFDLAYRRFKDLEKAEAQAIEATKQASLDRVRGEIASMRSAKDLEIITPLVWRELTTLGIPFIRCGVFIVHETEEEVEVYLSKPDGTSLAVMHLPFDFGDLTTRTVNAWRNGNVFTQHWSQEDFLDWGRTMMEQGQVPSMEIYQGAEAPPESLDLHFIPFNQGMLYVGSTSPLSEEEIVSVESLAKAFSIAYARYEDFVKLEKAKAGIEDALAELKATQSQLVQQEKLASLGQLTAGIAHEIKNPLNFVNNFSDLSLELIEEVRHEIRDMRRQIPSPVGEGQGEGEQSSETDLILNDIETNLRKIHEHGSRADSIVKSMLQHSRGGSGKMEPTDLNGLVKEYVNLSYHGMRAGRNPISADVEFDLDEKIGEVPLIAEDFSRVILNVCNNAFDAMRTVVSMSDNSVSDEYKPKLTVRTKSGNGSVIIEVEDNGSGIPDEIRDKILQPFYTTKKGTQGTGLGLSITNDIVKAHGGSLQMNSNVGEGSAFTIILPLNG